MRVIIKMKEKKLEKCITKRIKRTMNEIARVLFY